MDIELAPNSLYNITFQLSQGSHTGIGTITTRVKRGSSTQYSMTTSSLDFAKSSEIETLKIRTPKTQLVTVTMKDDMNILSELFQDRTADYLRQENYSAITREKPLYLNGKEIDVYAEKGLRPRKVIVCECKLNNVSVNDVAKFSAKAEKMKEMLSNIGAECEFWLVTAAEKVHQDVIERANGSRISLMNARLSSGWNKRADWKVVKLTPI